MAVNYDNASKGYYMDIISIFASFSQRHWCFPVIAAFLLMSCQSAPPSRTDQRDNNSITAEESQERLYELERQFSMGNIFDGNLPARISTIGIMRPSNPDSGLLSHDEMWYLDMIRIAMSSNFHIFAKGRIQVVNLSDEVGLARDEEIRRSLTSGSSDELSLSLRTAARAIMTGEIIKQPNNRFFLSFYITETETGDILAQYSRSHSDLEIMEGIAVNRATEELLRELHIVLNEAGRHALLRTSNEADIALARGLDAANAGMGLQAMNYLFNAATFDNTAFQANMTLTAIHTQNQAELQGAGEMVIGFFRDHTLMQERLDEFNNFYLSHGPFELFYTRPMPRNMRVTDTDRTYDLYFTIGLRWNENQISVMEQVLQEFILNGLNQIPSDVMQNFNLRGLPDDSQLFRGPENFVYNLVVNVENEHGLVIASRGLTLYGSLFRHQGRIYAASTQEFPISFTRIIYVEDQLTPNLFIRVVSINGIDIQTVGETGFMRVVPINGDRLPPVQPDTLPRELRNRLHRELIASENRAREAAQAAARRARETAQAANREENRLLRQQQKENHALRGSRVSIGAYGGPAFIADSDLTGTYNADIGLGSGGFEFDFGFFGFVGTSQNVFHATIAEDPYVWGLRFGLGYVYAGRGWLLRLIPGVSMLGIERSEPAIKTSSDGTTSEIKNNYSAVGSIQTSFDINPFRPGRGGFYLRIGHRLDIFQGKAAVVFNRYDGKVFFANSFIAGLVFYQ